MTSKLSWSSDDLERALRDLGDGLARKSANNALRNTLRPVARTANGYYASASEAPFRVAHRISRGQLADSQKQSGKHVLNMFVGASGDPKAHLLEWGTGPRYHKSGRYVGAASPQPALTPAWELHSRQMPEELGRRIWEQIEKRMAGK